MGIEVGLLLQTPLKLTRPRVREQCLMWRSYPPLLGGGLWGQGSQWVSTGSRGSLLAAPLSTPEPNCVVVSVALCGRRFPFSLWGGLWEWRRGIAAAAWVLSPLQPNALSHSQTATEVSIEGLPLAWVRRAANAPCPLVKRSLELSAEHLYLDSWDCAVSVAFLLFFPP